VDRAGRRRLLLFSGLYPIRLSVSEDDGCVHLCEPGLVRSPDGKRLAALLRENRRLKNAHVIFSRKTARLRQERRRAHRDPSFSAQSMKTRATDLPSSTPATLSIG